MDTSQIHDNKKEGLNCPRCNSTNTKFCYFNNYSLSQPRHLCKSCKRYWTRGGSLRNVPVGGGSRKNKRPSSSSSSDPPSTSSKKPITPNLTITPQNPKTRDLETLNLDSSSISHGMHEFGILPFGLNLKNLNPHQNPNFYTTTSLVSLPPPANPNPNSVFSSSSLSFSLDHHGYRNNQLEENPIAGFSFSTSTNVDHHEFDQHGKGQGGSNGYWHEMIDGGSW